MAWASIGKSCVPTSYKPYPCGFVPHPARSTALDWQRDHPNDVVQKVVVVGNPLMPLRANRPNITADANRLSACRTRRRRFVIGKAGLDQFTDACGQISEGAGAAQQGFELRQDAAILRSVAARVTITAAGGKTYELSQPAARAAVHANPMSDRDLEDKLRDAAPAGIPANDIAPPIEAIWPARPRATILLVAALTVPDG